MSDSVVSNLQPIYICEMMQRLGLDPGGGVIPRLSLTYTTALHRCEACPSKPACRTWLDGMPKQVAFAPEFCPNKDVVFELQVNEPCVNHALDYIEHDFKTKPHAHVADLERLEDELDELLLQKAADNPMLAELKQRKLRLQYEIEWLKRNTALRHDVAAGKDEPRRSPAAH